MPNIDLSILNQRQTPAFYADVFANRPAAGFVGRIFVSTNTFAFYRDNGTSWDLIGGPGTGTITGSGTAGTIPLWSGASTIGNSDLRQLSTEALILNSATDDWPITNFSNDPGRFLITSAANNPFLILWGKSAFGSGDESGSIALGNVTALGSTTFGGALINGYIENGTDGSGKLEIRTTNSAGLETLALTINSTQNTIFNNSIGINTATPGAAIDAHSAVNVIAQLNQTVATNNSLLAFQNNNTGLWRIGNFYNAGANDWGIFDVVGAIQPLTVKKTSGQVLIGTSTVGSGKLVVASATGDNGVQIVGASAPSLRIDNAESGPTKRAGFGISTATNNFIQGSADRDFCMFNGSTTASPILFGIYGTTNVQEAARISAARNLLVGSSVDSGERLQITGTANVTGAATFGSSIRSNSHIIVSDGSASVVLQGYINNNLRIAESGSGSSGGARGGLFVGAIDGQSANFSGAVGIGTTSPGAPLDVTNASAGININSTAANQTRRLYFRDAFGGGSSDSYIVSSSVLYFGAGGFSRIDMTLAGTGNLLIGTTTDNGNKLRVNGTAEAIKFQGAVNTISNSTNVFGSVTNGGQTYFEGNLSNGQQFGSTSGTYVVGIYFIFYYDSTTGLRGSAIYMAGNAVALSGFNLVTQSGALTFSATYNAAASISLAFDAALRGPILTNNTTNSLLFYAYVLGGS